MRRFARSVSVVVLVGFLVSGVAAVQGRLTSMKDASWFKPRLSYLPESEDLKPYLLGFETVFAGYLWIKTMLYFSEHFYGDRDFRWLVTMVDMTSKLNPRFLPPYEFAGLMLPEFCDAPDAARVILERGVTEFGPRERKLPFYLGWLYYRYFGDRVAAARYLSLAAQWGGKPYIAALAASMYADAGRDFEARAFLAGLHAQSDNPAVKRELERKLQELEEGRAGRERAFGRKLDR